MNWRPRRGGGTRQSTLAAPGQAIVSGRPADTERLIEKGSTPDDHRAYRSSRNLRAIFTYSQSSALASLAEQQLEADKIPSDALCFVMVGANPSGVDDNLYPTDVYNINGDFWAEPSSVGTTLQDIETGMLVHDAYLGLTPAEIDSATKVVEGMTTVFDIPTLTSTELWEALLSASSAV